MADRKALHARTSRGRDGAARTAAGHGGRAHRQAGGAPAATCAGRCRRISPGAVEGQTVTGIGRRAKYLTVDLSSGDVLLMHLGMSGSFRVSHEETNAPGAFHHPRSAAAAHDHVVFHMSSGATVTFNDPRRFGLMLLVPRAELASHPLMREVGPEPLGNAFDAGLLAAACAGKKTSLKAALLDQTVVAGLGNIYVCEALHRAQLSPDAAPPPSRPAARRMRAPPRWSTAIKAVLNDGDQGRRLVAARPSADRRRTRLFPASFSRLRPRRRTLRDPGMPGHGQAHRAERPLDVLLPGLPEVRGARISRQGRASP